MINYKPGRRLIQVPPGDFFFGKKERPACIPFLRSKVTPFPRNCKRRLLPDVENMNTPWIDMSYLYGSTEEKAVFLRAAADSGKPNSFDASFFLPLLFSFSHKLDAKNSTSLDDGLCQTLITRKEKKAEF